MPARPRPGRCRCAPTWQRYERNAAALDVATALDLARAELADPVSDRVIEAFAAAHEHGRDVIVAVLRSLADNVTKDLQLVEQIATSQTEIRSQAVIAVILPFGVLAFLVAANDGYRSFYQTTGGWIVVIDRRPHGARRLEAHHRPRTHPGRGARARRTRGHGDDRRPCADASRSLSAIAAGCLARAVVRQPRPLAERVQPARRRSPPSARHGSSGSTPRTTGRRTSGVMLVFGPFVRQLANGLAGSSTPRARPRPSCGCDRPGST